MEKQSCLGLQSFVDSYNSLIGHTNFAGRCVSELIELNSLGVALWINCKVVFEMFECIL